MKLLFIYCTVRGTFLYIVESLLTGSTLVLLTSI